MFTCLPRREHINDSTTKKLYYFSNKTTKNKEKQIENLVNLQSAELKYTFLVICTGRKSISCII